MHGAPPPPDEDGPATAPATRRARAQARAAALREHGRRLAERAQHERARHPSLDAAFEMADRDSEVGGGIMAGALAYRLFIWLLPLALVAVAGLGYASDAAAVDPEAAADSVGLAGIVSNSVASASKRSSRAYALLVGIPLLIMVTRSLLRTLIVAHRLVWTDARATVAKPTLVSSIQFLLALGAFLAISTLTSALRHSSLLAGTFALFALVVPYSAMWLLISMRLPHRDAPWRSLVPGAILLGLGVEGIQIFTTWYIAPATSSKQGTYGALGIAAALLLGLFFVSRIIIATAVVNATLWDRRARAAPVPTPTAPR